MDVDLNKIRRIQSTFDEAEANKALSHGWQLAGIAPGVDESNFPIIKYTLGHHLTEEEVKANRAAAAAAAAKSENSNDE